MLLAACHPDLARNPFPAMCGLIPESRPAAICPIAPPLSARACSFTLAWLRVMRDCFLLRQQATLGCLGSLPALGVSLPGDWALFLSSLGQRSVWPPAGQRKDFGSANSFSCQARRRLSRHPAMPLVTHQCWRDLILSPPPSLALVAKVAGSPDGSSGTKRTSLSLRSWPGLAGTLR